MAEPIDELLVRLKLHSDAKGFKDANNQFSGLRTTAIQAGAVIGTALAGTAVALGRMSADVARSRNEFGGWAKAFNVNAQWADKVRHAMVAIGGSDAEAKGLIENVDNLREMAKWGDLASKAFTANGFSPQAIQSMSTPDATDYLSRGISSIEDPDLRKRVLNSLSFSTPNQQNLMSDHAGFTSRMADAERLGVASDSIIKASAAYVEASAQAQTQLANLKDMIALELLPKMTEWTMAMTGWVADHKQGAAEAVKIMTGPGTPLEKAKELGSNEAVRSTAGSIGSAYGNWADFATGWHPANMMFHKIMDGIKYEPPSEGETSSGRLIRDANGKVIRSAADGEPAFPPASKSGLSSGEMGYNPSSSELIPNSNLSEQIHGYKSLLHEDIKYFDTMSSVPSFGRSGRGAGSSGTQNYYSIDARGSTDPAATEAAVRRVVDERISNAVKISRDGIPNNVA